MLLFRGTVQWTKLICLSFGLGLVILFSSAAIAAAPSTTPLPSAPNPDAIPSGASASILTRTLPITGGAPTAVEAYHAGTKFYVAESLSGQLWVYDGATHRLTATIPISGNVLEDTLVVNEAHGRAYALSGDRTDLDFGAGSGLIYVVSTITDSVLATIDPIPYLTPYAGTTRLVAAQDVTRNRVYYGGYGLFYINAATGAVVSFAEPSNPLGFPLSITEMAIDETRNTLYMVQWSYGNFFGLWVLDVGAVSWTWLDLEPAGCYYPQHVAVSAPENKLFVKCIGVPGQTEPGIYVRDLDTGDYTFIGNDDYGYMDINESTGQLFTGVEVGQNVAVVGIVSNTLDNVPVAQLGGSAPWVQVRKNTNHAFADGMRGIAIIDGASRTNAIIPVPYEDMGGTLVQDLAVNQNTGWVYAIPDARQPYVAAILDPPAGPVGPQPRAFLPVIMR